MSVENSQKGIVIKDGENQNSCNIHSLSASSKPLSQEVFKLGPDDTLEPNKDLKSIPEQNNVASTKVVISKPVVAALSVGLVLLLIGVVTFRQVRRDKEDISYIDNAFIGPEPLLETTPHAVLANMTNATEGDALNPHKFSNVEMGAQLIRPAMNPTSDRHIAKSAANGKNIINGDNMSSVPASTFVSMFSSIFMTVGMLLIIIGLSFLIKLHMKDIMVVSSRPSSNLYTTGENNRDDGSIKIVDIIEYDKTLCLRETLKLDNKDEILSIAPHNYNFKGESRNLDCIANGNIKHASHYIDETFTHQNMVSRVDTSPSPFVMPP